MHKRLPACLLATSVVFLAACASIPPEDFLQSYRDNYRFTDEEFSELQFFVSGDVLVQFEDADGPASMLLNEGTPGICTFVGPNWLRISFRDGGYDAPFVSAGEHDRYWLASNGDGGQSFQRLSEMNEQSFVLDGVEYTVIRGADVHLRVDPRSLQALIDKRIVSAEGRTVDG